MIRTLSRTAFRTMAPCLAGLMVGGAWAQPVHDGHGPGAHRDFARERYAFRGHDVRRFRRDDRVRWRGGHWRNSCFGGRCGWWWLAGGQWYFYDRPVYPYPVVVSGIGFAEPMVMAPPPIVITAPPPVMMPAPIHSAPRIAPAPQFWCYCDNPAGYFPTVQTCNTQFRQVEPPPH